MTIETGPLFTAETGTVLTAAHIGHYLLARRGKLPIDELTTHDLRRTVATMLVEIGVALDLVAAVVGHKADGRKTRTLVATMSARISSSARLMCCALGDEQFQNIVTAREAANVIRFE